MFQPAFSNGFPMVFLWPRGELIAPMANPPWPCPPWGHGNVGVPRGRRCRSPEDEVPFLETNPWENGDFIVIS